MLDYADRCERYARQRGWSYDPRRLSIGHLTPAQKRRALKKERHVNPCYTSYWDDDDYLSYLPEGRVLDMIRYPDNRHLY